MHTNILTIPQWEKSHQPSTKKEQEKWKMLRLVIRFSIKECQGWGKDIKKKASKWTKRLTLGSSLTITISLTVPVCNSFVCIVTLV